MAPTSLCERDWSHRAENDKPAADAVGVHPAAVLPRPAWRPGGHRRAARRCPPGRQAGLGSTAAGWTPTASAAGLSFSARWLQSLSQREVGAIVTAFGADREHPHDA